MKYKHQKTMAYLQIFVGTFILGYNAVKYLKIGFNPHVINIPLVIAVGILLPLSGVFALQRIKAQAKRERMINPATEQE